MTGQPGVSIPLTWAASQQPADWGAAGRRLRSARTCWSASRPSSRRRRRGPTGVPPCTPEPVGVRVGGGQGFYGDTPRSVAGLLDAGVDYLCLEALAELTLAILQKDRQRDETRGFTRDLPAYLSAALPAVAAGRTKVITNAGGINPTAAARAAVDTARDARPVRDQGRDRARRRPHRTPRRHRRRQAPLTHLETGAPFTEFPAPALFAVGVPRRAADRRRVGGRRRRRRHRPGRRRGAVPRAARARARLVLRRLGPPRRRHAGRAPARVLGAERGREPQPRLVDRPPALGPARTRSPRSRPTAARSSPSRTRRAGGSASTPSATSCSTRSTTPTAYLSPDVVADFTVGAGSSTRATTGFGSPTSGAGPPPRPTRRCSATTPAGPARRGSRSRGPTRPRRPPPPRRSSPSGSAAPASPSTSGASSCLGVDALGGPTVPAATAEAPEVVLRAAWRCADAQHRRRWSGGRWCPSPCPAPPAGLAAMGRGAVRAAASCSACGRPSSTRPLIDPQVTVTLEEVR